MFDRQRLGLISLDYGSPREALDAARERGFGYLEVYIDAVEDEEVRSLAKWADRHGVRLTTISTLSKLGSAEDDFAQHAAAVARSIRLASELGVPRAGFMFGGSGQLDGRAARRRFGERVLPLAEQAASAGVQLVIENVFTRAAGVDLESVDDILDLFLVVPPGTLALTFDPANLMIGGEEPYPYAFTRLGQHISVVHLKDVTRHIPERHGPEPDCRPLVEARRGRSITLPLGQGSLNMAGLVRALVNDLPQVPLLLEPFRRGRSREAWIDRSLAWLDELSEDVVLDG
jgi:sugar phosphate isomerase/epimerase